MTIVRIIARLNVGGPARQAVDLTARLGACGHHCHLLVGEVPPDEGDAGYLAEESGIQPVFISGLSRRVSLWSDAQAFWHILLYLRRVRPDVVHTHTAKAGALGRVAAWLCGIPAVHTYHGHVFHGYFSKTKTRVFIQIERGLARLSAAIVAISESQRHELGEVYRVAPLAKIHMVRLGFDLNEFQRGAAERALAPPPPRLRLGWVGRFTPIKDPLLFCRIAQACRAAGLEADFTMYGGGEMLEVMQKELRRLGLESSVRIAGWQHDIAGVYRELDVLLLTSHNEGTPVAIIEAMASGCGVISSACGGVEDILGARQRSAPGFEAHELGWLVRERDPDAFVSALQDFLAHPSESTARRTRAIDRAAERYGQDRLVHDIDSLYRQIVNPRTARHAPA